MKYLENGSFVLKDFSKYNYLYLPLCNHYGLKSAITPNFNGDLKIDQHHFALPPASNLDLLNGNNARNVWFVVNNDCWSITGNSIYQDINKDIEEVECGFLYQKVTRQSSKFMVEVTSFVPEINDNIEMHKVVFTNTSNEVLGVTPCVGIPIYGRSADNIRDHRHVTSLLNRVTVCDNLIYNEPTLSFDERGHNLNETIYSVMVSDISGKKPVKYYKSVDSFIGEGGSFRAPKALNEDYEGNDSPEGYEVLAGFKYERMSIKPGEKITLVFGIGIATKVPNPSILNDFDSLFIASKEKWESYFNYLSFDYSHNTFIKWATIQPVLRRIYGCSFLPHHDYGKGGRGWRDLWQDCLSLLKMNPKSIKDMLINNFKGVRIDGSNATIIGDGLGEFKADRNNISRMWMDHGAWPLITMKEYLHNTNDYQILLEEIPYFKDSHINFSAKIDEHYNEKSSPLQQTKEGTTYYGSILEHLLVENIPIFFNVGEHNNYRLMGADWNDALDMASQNGESIAFTALYAQNLLGLCEIIKHLGFEEIEVFEELATLIETSYVFTDIKAKHSVLDKYFLSVAHLISGKKVKLKVTKLTSILEKMFKEIKEHLQENEWLQENDLGYFNSYYDNDKMPLDSIEKKSMLLTPQVFTIMSGIASKEQTAQIVYSADKLLYEPQVGGYRLNTNFKQMKTNMGRLFGFAYGHKENGAVFSHMTVMYANALYQQGFVLAGHKALKAIIDLVENFEISKVYPSIPEYFDSFGRGMYPYLTGSASWLILTMIDQVFGIRVKNGYLSLEPKLCLEDFKEHRATITTKAMDRVVKVTYLNPEDLDYGEYEIKQIMLDDELLANNIDITRIKEFKELQVVLGARNKTNG